MHPQRHELPLIADLRTLAVGYTEHHALARAVDVGVEDSGFRARPVHR